MGFRVESGWPAYLHAFESVVHKRQSCSRGIAVATDSRSATTHRIVSLFVAGSSETHDFLLLGLELVLRQDPGIGQVLQLLDRLYLLVERQTSRLRGNNGLCHGGGS